MEIMSGEIEPNFWRENDNATKKSYSGLSFTICKIAALQIKTRKNEKVVSACLLPG
jgi:hypothetical protein